MRIRSAEDLGVVARERRRELGLSQADLAERADVTRQWVIRFERGASDVSFSRAVAVLRVLNLDLRVGAAGSQPRIDVHPAAVQFRVPKIDVPRIDLSGIDWQVVTRRLAATKVDLSASVAGLRALSVQDPHSPAAIAVDEESSSDA